VSVCSDTSAKTAEFTSTPDILITTAKSTASAIWFRLEMYGFQENAKKNCATLHPVTRSWNSRYLCHITHTVTCCVQPNIGLVDRIYYIWYNLLHTAQRSKREGLVYNVLLGY